MTSRKPDLTRMSVEDRINLAEKIYVLYPRLKEILSKIKHCHRYSMNSAEPECMLIKGDTGAGKTTLYRHYEKDHPRRVSKERTIIPVLSASIPVPATPKSLATRLLANMGDPVPGGGTLTLQTLRLLTSMKACGVELIILDEFQHFIDRDSNKVLQTISDWLKDLLNNSRTPVVLIGMPHCEEILERNAQLRRRFAVRESLDSFGWEHDDPETQKELRKDFRCFLTLLDSRLPLVERSTLADPSTAYLIHCATGGNVAAVVKLLRRAVAIALSWGEEKISPETLAAAYDDRLADNQPGIKNPFIL